MERRTFITLLGATTASWPVAVRAQQQMRRIGILMGGAEGDWQSEAGLAALKTALSQLGWTDGQNTRIDVRWAGGNVDRMKVLAKELVGLPSDLLVAHTTQPVAALQRETKTIPIVFLIVYDPVGSGFVASLPSPGGNITGFSNIESSLGGKWIEVLREVAPNVSRAALMFNPDTAPRSSRLDS
jgi:putative ABC transport system substrate-binding protein